MADTKKVGKTKGMVALVIGLFLVMGVTLLWAYLPVFMAPRAQAFAEALPVHMQNGQAGEVQATYAGITTVLSDENLRALEELLTEQDAKLEVEFGAVRQNGAGITVAFSDGAVLELISGAMVEESQNIVLIRYQFEKKDHSFRLTGGPALRELAACVVPNGKYGENKMIEE